VVKQEKYIREKKRHFSFADVALDTNPGLDFQRKRFSAATRKTSSKMTHHRQPQHQHHLFPQSYGFEDTADQQGDGGYYAGEGGPGPSTFISTTPISPPGSQGYQHPQGIIISKICHLLSGVVHASICCVMLIDLSIWDDCSRLL
jgi:hypothetical protein